MKLTVYETLADMNILTEEYKELTIIDGELYGYSELYKDNIKLIADYDGNKFFVQEENGKLYDGEEGELLHVTNMTIGDNKIVLSIGYGDYIVTMDCKKTLVRVERKGEKTLLGGFGKIKEYL